MKNKQRISAVCTANKQIETNSCGGTPNRKRLKKLKGIKLYEYKYAKNKSETKSTHVCTHTGFYRKSSLYSV